LSGTRSRKHRTQRWAALWAAKPKWRYFLEEAVFKVLRRQDGLDEGWCNCFGNLFLRCTNIEPAGLTVLVTL
jgi:hypothetical protein